MEFLRSTILLTYLEANRALTGSYIYDYVYVCATAIYKLYFTIEMVAEI